jgi:hypothetical protein
VLLFEYKFVSCTLGVPEPAELAFYGLEEEFLTTKWRRSTSSAKEKCLSTRETDWYDQK